MSFEAVDLVIKSGIEEPGEFCVLLALAHCLNDKTGDCFPSTATIAKIARKSPRVVRQSLRSLEERRIVLSTQPPGGVRRFMLCLDAIPANPLYEVQPLSKTQGVNETTPLAETSALPCRKGQGTPVENARGPLSKTTAEQGIEQGKEQGIEQGSMSPLAPASDELVLSPDSSEPKTKAKRSKTTVDRPDDVDPQVWDEFIVLRTKKGKTFTDLALKGIRREADAAGITVEKAMTMCVENGWQSFQARYVRDKGSGGDRSYRRKKEPTCPGDWENEFKGVDYTRGAVMKEFTPEESARLATLAEEMNF